MANEDLRIVLLGKTGAGKSSSGNTILGRECFEEGDSMESFTKTCHREHLETGGKIISVIDTPGLFDTTIPEQELNAEIKKCVDLSLPGPHVFMLVIRLDMKFTDEEKNAVKWIQENYGEEAAHYTIVLFTHADHLKGKPLEEFIRKCKDLQVLVDELGGRFHAFNNEDTDNLSQVTELMKKIERMVRENGGQHYTNEMYKNAQLEIEWDNLKQNLKTCGTNTLALIGGGALAAGVVAAAGGAAVAAGAVAEVEVGAAAAAATAGTAAAGGAMTGAITGAAGEAVGAAVEATKSAVAIARAKLGL